MNKLSEQEILNIVYDITIYRNDNDGLSNKEYQAIQGLLDLYNKEKEKNKELDTENWIMRTVDKQYINKNKIKEKLEKYSPNHTNTFIENQEKYIKLITELQELIKE